MIANLFNQLYLLSYTGDLFFPLRWPQFHVYYGTYSSTVNATNFFLRPSAFCFTKASLPRKSTSDLSLHVKPSRLSRGVSSERRSACQWRYPGREKKEINNAVQWKDMGMESSFLHLRYVDFPEEASDWKYAITLCMIEIQIWDMEEKYGRNVYLS